jgi:hypothetical protein
MFVNIVLKQICKNYYMFIYFMQIYTTDIGLDPFCSKVFTVVASGHLWTSKEQNT